MTAGPRQRERYANGNRMWLWDFDEGEGNSAVRRLAASLPRDMDGLQKVDYSPACDVQVWLEEVPDGDDMRSFTPPEGYSIVEVSTFETGAVCVDLEEDA